MKIPNKCLNCNHTIMAFENVHKGFCRFELEEVIRCDCAPQQYPVGCVSAEVYCRKAEDSNDNERNNLA